MMRTPEEQRAHHAEQERIRRRRIRGDAFGTRRRADPTERFWKKVSKSDGCWLWTGSVTNSGYGQFFPMERKMVTAHRWAYMTFVAPIPEKMFVCHRCDTKRCVRPDHLFLGTHSDNMRDMVSKGRHPEQRNKARFAGAA